MKGIIITLWAGLMLVGSAGFVLAQDAGVPDTLYVEIYPADYTPGGDPPYFVRFPIYVTHDIVDPVMDSLAGITVCLDYEHSNPAAFCSASGYWNNTWLYPHADHNRSIFRHFIEGNDTLIENRMMKEDVAGDDGLGMGLQVCRPVFQQLLAGPGSYRVSGQKMGRRKQSSSGNHDPDAGRQHDHLHRHRFYANWQAFGLL